MDDPVTRVRASPLRTRRSRERPDGKTIVFLRLTRPQSHTHSSVVVHCIDPPAQIDPSAHDAMLAAKTGLRSLPAARH